MKVVITGACAVSARSVLRSLKMSEIFGDSFFVGWDTCAVPYEVYAGNYDRLYKVPAVNDPRYAEVVQGILDKEKPDAVMLLPEVEVLYWARHPFDVPHLIPPVEFCEVAISKRRLFEVLRGSGLVPRFVELNREEVFCPGYEVGLDFPLWIRDDSAGTASGKGSFLAESLEELRAWVVINRGVECFQVSEFCPGENYGVLCLFENGKLIKCAVAERMEYIMSKVSVSGVTGNTGVGRFVNDEYVKGRAVEAVRMVSNITGAVMNGVVVVDLKVDAMGVARVTEINVRYVAFNGLLARAGFNLAEYHLLTILGRSRELEGCVSFEFPKGNMWFRDVDAVPVYVEDYKELEVRDCVAK